MVKSIEVPITQGYKTLVSECDYEKVSARKWFAMVCHRSRRVCVGTKIEKKVRYLHRYIMDLQPGDERVVDHIDHDPLNNSRENLRIVSRVDNTRYQLRRINNTSGYKGVTWDRDANRWAAQIEVYGKNKRLGRFRDIIEAAKAYDQAARDIHGEFAVTNFGDEIK